MFRYKLRTLLILLAIGPPALAAIVWLLHGTAKTNRIVTISGDAPPAPPSGQP